MGANKKRSSIQKTASPAVKVADDEAIEVQPIEIKKKIKHKKTSETPLMSNTLSKKTKTSMKKALTKIFSKEAKTVQPQSRYSLEQLETRRLYILSTIAKGNITFKDDMRSLSQTSDNTSSPLITDHSNIKSSTDTSSIAPIIGNANTFTRKKSILRNNSVLSSKSKIGFMEKEPENRRVSFANESDEVIVMPVNRAPPTKDNPIFDSSKSWITRLMNLKPKKSSIKILIDKKDTTISKRKRIADPIMQDENQIQSQNQSQSSQTDNSVNQMRHHHFHRTLHIDERLNIDYSKNRVMYEEGTSLYLVNTRFSYTS